jgi:hypothetical protein
MADTSGRFPPKAPSGKMPRISFITNRQLASIRKAGTATAAPRKNSFNRVPTDPFPNDPERRIIKRMKGSGRYAAISNTVRFIFIVITSFVPGRISRIRPISFSESFPEQISQN